MLYVVGEALVDLVGQRGGRTFAAHAAAVPRTSPSDWPASATR